MAHSYTPGLKVLKNTVIFKERRLPLKGQVESKTGDVVKPDDVVANTDLPGNVQMINVANLLNADASDIENYMIKGKGELIEKDGLLAETKGLFGFFKFQCSTSESLDIPSRCIWISICYSCASK